MEWRAFVGHCRSCCCAGFSMTNGHFSTIVFGVSELTDTLALNIELDMGVIAGHNICAMYNF